MRNLLNLNDGLYLAERIRQELWKRCDSNWDQQRHPVSFTVSIGIARWHRRPRSSSRHYRADKALVLSKKIMAGIIQRLGRSKRSLAYSAHVFEPWCMNHRTPSKEWIKAMGISLTFFWEVIVKTIKDQDYHDILSLVMIAFTSTLLLTTFLTERQTAPLLGFGI